MTFEAEVRQFAEGHETLLIGIGSRLRRDDALGLEVADELASSGLKGVHSLEMLEDIPEVVSNSRPDRIMIIDAADMGMEPGGFRVIPGMGHGTICTHKLPLRIAVELALRLHPTAEVMVIGIQPEEVVFGEGLTQSASRSKEMLVDLLGRVLAKE